MINKIFYLILLFFLSNVTAQVTVVVADFENNSGGFNLDYWEKAIPDFLTSELSTSNRIVIVERNKLDKVLEEQALGLTGILDSSNVKEVGKLLNAQYIIQGTINQVNGKCRIDANIIKVKTGEVKSEKVIAPNESHLEEMTLLLSNNIKKVLVGQGTYIEKTKIVLDGNGGIHFSSNWNWANFTGTGLTSGDTYVVTQTFSHTEHDFVGVNDVESFTLIFNFHLVSKGSGDNIRLHGVNHYTVNANGELTVDKATFSIVCK